MLQKFYKKHTSCLLIVLDPPHDGGKHILFRLHIKMVGRNQLRKHTLRQKQEFIQKSYFFEVFLSINLGFGLQVMARIKSSKLLNTWVEETTRFWLWKKIFTCINKIILLSSSSSSWSSQKGLTQEISCQLCQWNVMYTIAKLFAFCFTICYLICNHKQL